MPLIVFEDEHLLVVNKPNGWNTHAPSPYHGEGIYEWLKHREPRWASLGILHRLDKETSGILMFGRTREAHQSLTHQFAAREIRKTYLLLTDKPVPTQDVTAISSLVRAGERYVSRPVHTGSDVAETRFKATPAAGGLSQIEVEPVTGRTHQIRVHAAERGFPVFGDTLYGGTPAPRVFLHAWRIHFKHPTTGRIVVFSAEPPWNLNSESGAPRAYSYSALPRSELRQAIIDEKATDCYRIAHGESDGWPGVYIDKIGDWLLAQSAERLTDAQQAVVESWATAISARGVYSKRLSRAVGQSNVNDTSPQLVAGAAAPPAFMVRENGLSFELSFAEGYSIGLFLDQRDNRRRFLVNHVGDGFTLFPAGAQNATVLNAFAYTCGFSAAAAKAGAHVTSLDLSKKYLEWGKRNFAHNGIDPAEHDFIFGDVFDWMRRLTRKARVFDCIVLDPPTFSHSKTGGAWRAEKNFGALIEAALPLLKPGGVLLACTNAAKLNPDDFLRMIVRSVAGRRRQIVREQYAPQPPDFPVSRGEPAYLKAVWLRIK